MAGAKARQYLNGGTNKSNEGFRAMSKSMLLLSLFCMCSPALAEYVATGPIEGNVCKGFGIEVCSTHTIVAVKGDDGRMYTVNRQFPSVTEYKEKTGRCWINTKAKGWGLISSAINAAKQPVFFERSPSGEYKELDVEYLTFKCAKR